MEKKFVKLFDKINVLLEESLDRQGTLRDKCTYFVDGLNKLFTTDYLMEDDQNNEYLDKIPSAYFLMEYWMEQEQYLPGVIIDTRERLRGIVHSILCVFDGCAGANDFRPILIKENGKVINYSEELHELWARYHKERREAK